MLRRIARRLQVQPGEGRTTLLMLLYIFGVMTFYYVLKPLRSGLFLKTFPATHLPYAYLLTALLAGTLAALTFKLNRYLSVIRLVTAINVGIILTLVFFRWALGREMFLLPYFYYVYVQIVSVLSTTQFWLLAGYLYDSRQAKRIFPLLGSGAIVGSMAGSAIPSFLSKYLSTQAMLLLCIAVVIALILIARAAWRQGRPESARAPEVRRWEETPARVRDLFGMVLGSRHLLLLCVMILLTLIASQMADWQVNAAAGATYDHLPREDKERAINTLFARFNLILNIISFVMQLTLTRFVIRRFGIGAATLLLPASLMAASAGVLVFPVLLATLLAEGSNTVFRYSVHRVGTELLYLPLSPEARKKIKLFIDVFVDRFGRALAGILILGLAGPSLALGLRSTAALMLLLCGLSIAVSLWLQRSYLEAFRRKLTRREVDLSEMEDFVSDPVSVRMLTETLESPQDRQILYALGLLQSVRGVDFSSRLLPLLEHRASHVRETAVRTLHALPADYREDAGRMLADPKENVRVAAVEYLCSYDMGSACARLESFLTHEDIEVRLAAARCAAENPPPELHLSIDLVRSYLSFDGPQASRSRAAAAWLAVHLPTEHSISLLTGLLADPDRMVAGAAARAAGRAGHPELVSEMLKILARPPLRAAAREGLLSLGPRALDLIEEVLADGSQPAALRREIPWLLGRMPAVRSAEILLDHIHAEDPRLKFEVVKALNRLHDQDPSLPPPRPVIAERIYAETRAYYEAMTIYGSLAREAESDSSRLLLRSLRERLDQNLEVIFRLLGLQYAQEDIYSAFAALRGGRPERRSSAIEFLDNLLQDKLKSMILPLVEESSWERLAERASRFYGVSTPTKEDAIGSLLRQKDAWLKVCALHEAGASGMKQFREECRRLARESDPLIRQTAEWALERLG